jgi:excisionase family DNA binding protein
MAQEILEGFITISEAARQLGKSERTIQRMISQRQLAFTRHGRGTLVHVDGSREAFLSHVVKPVITPRRGQR